MKLTEKEFLEMELKNGISLDNPSFVKLGEETFRNILREIHSVCGVSGKVRKMKILDFGPGVGAYSKPFLEDGYNIVAYEKFESHRDYLAEHLPTLILTDEPVPADIMLMIEVAEHMTDEEIIGALDKVRPKYLVFSSTSKKTAQDKAWGHINIKVQYEWEDFMKNQNYLLARQLDFPTNWTYLYVRHDH